MIENILRSIFGNPISIFAIFIGLLGYIAINAFYTGSVWLLNLRVNSNTKKAKKLLKYGVWMTAVSFIALSILIPYLDYKSEVSISNPYIGVYKIKSEGNSKSIAELDQLNIYIGPNNTIVGDFSRSDGKLLAYFRNSEINHLDYSLLKGDFSSEIGERFHFVCQYFIDECECNLADKNTGTVMAKLIGKKK